MGERNEIQKIIISYYYRYNDYIYWNTLISSYYGKKQCTWWAFKRRAQLGKPVSNRWGNAKNWYSNARRSGYATGHKPRKYAVMQSTRGYYGHVAVVEKVYKNGKIKISEYNYNVPLGYGTRIISKSSARNYNYIY